MTSRVVRETLTTEWVRAWAQGIRWRAAAAGYRGSQDTLGLLVWTLVSASFLVMYGRVQEKRARRRPRRDRDKRTSMAIAIDLACLLSTD